MTISAREDSLQKGDFGGNKRLYREPFCYLLCLDRRQKEGYTEKCIQEQSLLGVFFRSQVYAYLFVKKLLRLAPKSLES